MRVRRTSRLILLDDEDRVLLFKVDDRTVFRPDDPAAKTYWLTPGGSLEPGEGHAAAARRELWEETGIAGIAPGPWVALSEPVLNWAGELIRAHDRYYLTRLGAVGITLSNMTDEERGTYQVHRWRAVADLRASGERVVPPGLLDLLARLIAGEVPPRPVRLD